MQTLQSFCIGHQDRSIKSSYQNWEWDTSQFFNMNHMFYKTLKFNQDITGWCVTNFLFEPEGFSFDSALIKINKPIWGNCSTNLPSSILSSQL